MSTGSNLGPGCKDRLATASSLATILCLIVTTLALLRSALDVTLPLGCSNADLICTQFGNDEPDLTSSMLAAARPRPANVSASSASSAVKLNPTITPILPTATPSPTITPMPPTATPGPTITPAPPTATPVTTVVLSASTPISTQVVYSATTPHTFQAPTLLNPGPDAQLHGIVWFQWERDGPPLPEGLAFDLLIWSEEEHQEHQGTGAYGVIEPGPSLERDVDLDSVQTIIEHGGGTYYWTVIVVQKEPYERVGAWGENRVVIYALPEPPAESGSKSP
jgi:hypothetical protein